MTGSLAISLGSAWVCLIQAVAETHTKNVIKGDIVKSLHFRDFRSTRSYTSSTDISGQAPTTRQVGNVIGELYRLWHDLPEVARFFVAGNLGNAGFFFLERQINIFISLCPIEMVPAFVLAYQDGVSFFVGYLLQIVSTHLLLAVLVYGVDTIDSVEKYCKTLSGQFYAYAFSLFGSTILSTFLQQRGVERTTAIFGTMLTFACVNYFLIGWIVKRAVASAMSHSKDEKLDNNLLNINIGRVSATKKARRNDKVQHGAKERQPNIRNAIGKGFADMMGRIQRGGAFNGGGKTHNENHPILLFEPVPVLSLREYVEQTGYPPKTVETVNQNR
jgi:hypothetical protein